MEKFKETLCRFNINTTYLNLDTLREYAGDDLLETAAEILLPSEMIPSPLMSDFVHKKIIKYRKNLLVHEMFNHFYGVHQPHAIMYDLKKYANLDSSVLNLSTRDIFVVALKYFLNEDIGFLNIDAIYDEAESFFSELIRRIRNNDHAVGREEGVFNREMACFLKVEECPVIEIFKKPNQMITKSNLMTYIIIWCSFVMAKKKFLSMSFVIRSKNKYEKAWQTLSFYHA